MNWCFIYNLKIICSGWPLNPIHWLASWFVSDLVLEGIENSIQTKLYWLDWILDLIKLDSTQPTKMLKPIIGIVFSVKLQITCIDFTLLAYHSWSFSLENYPFDLEAFNCILLFMFIYYFDSILVC